jgi:hypothetical protein
MTFATGARQLVVHDAFETTFMSLVYFNSLTPITNKGISSLGGEEIITFLAPPLKCAPAVALVVNYPVDSQIYSAPALPHSNRLGSLSENILTK